jgi:hypothetical protein
MKELPKSDWTFHQEGADSIIVGAHEHNGYRWYTRVALADLPNDLVSLNDLERLGVDLIDARAIAEYEPLEAPGD